MIGLISKLGNCSVHDIKLRLEAKGNQLAYTTVMTILTRLFEKGHLKREKHGRKFIYSVVPSTEKARQGVFSTIYQSLFGARITRYSKYCEGIKLTTNNLIAGHGFEPRTFRL